jgi:hypothetical protein
MSPMDVSYFLGQLVGLLGRGIGPTQDLYLHTGQHNTEKCRHTHIHASGRIRTHNPNVRVVQDQPILLG